MKITGIEIERFGQWNQLSLPLASDGLTVIGGANESGKSALRRLIRGVLFGFRGDDVSESEAWSRRLPCVGALRVRHRGQVFEIRRTAHDGGAGSVTTRWLPPANATMPSRSLVEHCGWETDDQSQLEMTPDDEAPTVPLSDTLAELLGDLPERMFDHVFSLGLCELHELSTLGDDEVAKAVHGETLGPDGQKLLTARDRLSEAIDCRWDESRHGSLSKLLDQYEQLSAQIQSHSQRLTRYTDLMRTRRNHEHRLTELQSRRANMREQLRGYTHIERVWTPWQRLRNLQSERLRLPRIDDFPEGGISRFDLVEQELLAAVNCNDSLIAEAKQLHREAKKIAVPRELRRTASTMRNLLEQREHTARLEERARQAHAAMMAQRNKLDQLVQTLGPEWSLARLESLDTSITAHYRLVEKARQFRRAIARRNRWKVRLVRLSQTCQQHTTELDEALKKLNGLSLDEALRKARQRQAAVPVASVIAPAALSAATFAAGAPQVEHLPMRIVELEQRRVSLSRQLERLEPQLILPTWVLSVLGFFALSGVLLAIIGLVTGISTSALGGAAYALLGTAFGGLALSLKMHFEQQVRESIGQLHEELRDNESRLRDARDAWQRIVGVPPSGGSFDETARVHVANLAGTGAVETISNLDLNSFSLDELEGLQETKTRIARWQRQRGLWRDRFDAAARDLTAARQAWCQTLTQFGLPECVRVNDSFELWQRLAAANEQRRTWQAAEIEFKRHVEAVQNIRSRVLEILHRLKRHDLDQMPTLEVFQLWEAELQQLSATLQERLHLRRDERRRRAEAAEYREKIDDLRQQRSALLRQGCATDRDDFARRAIIVTRHEELNRQIDDTKAELDAASRAIPELAIVEEDLVRFDASRHVELLRRLRSEADDTDREIEQLHEELGRIRHEIEDLEADDKPSDLRLEREIVRSQIQAAAEEWLADEWVAQALDEIRVKYERICQPGVLAAASRYLARLTEGRYRTLWTPLRHRSLQVDDATGNTCRLEQLSGSTRELLLLSIRLALVEEFGRKGVDLPLLLDDVLLTLDPSRAAVAANELIDFARHGHQVLLFTCHPHLASLFTMAGCPNIRLSQTEAAAERLAG